MPILTDDGIRCVNPRLVHGFAAGLAAGAIFLAAQALGEAALTGDLFAPLRMPATLVRGEEALHPANAEVAAMVAATGLVVHCALSAAWGGLFGVLMGHVERPPGAAHALLGAAYGSVIYLIDHQVVARVLFPWYIAHKELFAWSLHALAFGVPLALLFTAFERGPLDERADPAVPVQ